MTVMTMTNTAGEIDLCWPAEPAAVTRARHAAVAFASDAGADADVQHRVALAVSEAATNAVLHAYRDGAGPGHVALVATRDAGVLRFSISDDGVGLSPRPDSPGLGVGLALMARLADHIDVEEGQRGGTRVCLRFGR